MSTKHRIVIFTALSLVLSWGILALAIFTGRGFNNVVFILYSAAPAVLSIFMRILFEHKDFRDLGLFCVFKPYEIFLYAILPIAALIIDRSMFVPFYDFVIFWLVFGLAASVFEEIAFRGWLAPRLFEVFNLPSIATAFIGGIIWGIWLLPLCFFYRGDFFIGHASDPFGYFLVFLSFFGFVIASGLCGITLLEMRLRSGSIPHIIVIRAVMSMLLFVSVVLTLAIGSVMALFTYSFYKRMDYARTIAPEFLEANETFFSRPDILRKLTTICNKLSK